MTHRVELSDPGTTVAEEPGSPGQTVTQLAPVDGAAAPGVEPADGLDQCAGRVGSGRAGKRSGVSCCRAGPVVVLYRRHVAERCV